MIKITQEDLKELTFDGIIVGVPSYVEVDQHKDILFKITSNEDKSAFYSIYYNPDSLPKGLSMATQSNELTKIFRFDSYDYFKFEDMIEFCTWYLQRQNKSIEPEVPSVVKPMLPIKRKDKLKEVRDYVQQVLNIEYYKNFSIFTKNKDKETVELAENMAEKLKQNLVAWLEEEV